MRWNHSVNILQPAPTSLDWNFRLFGTPVRVSVWFWIGPALLGIPFARTLGIGSVFILLACCFVSILLHEFGHVFAWRLFGRRSNVVLNGFGGVAIASGDLPSRWQRVTVYAAGPFVQLLLGCTLWMTSGLIVRWLRLGSSDPVRQTLYCMTAINLAWPLFNLLPIWPLDGRQIAWEFVRGGGDHRRPPWEQDDDWWKRGIPAADLSPADLPEEGGRWANRVFLALVIVAGVWAFLRVDKGRRQSEAFQAFKSLGTRVGWDGESQYYGFDFQGTGIDDDKLKLPTVFDDLDHIDLTGTRVTDRGVSHLRGLRKLKMLHLGHTRVTDAGLADLRDLLGRPRRRDGPAELVPRPLPSRARARTPDVEERHAGHCPGRVRRDGPRRPEERRPVWPRRRPL